MYKHILLPLDGSALAEQALAHAVAQAAQFQAELILLKVLEPLAKNINISLAQAWRAEKATHELAREYLEGIAAGVRGRDIPVRVVTADGKPHEEIVSCARGGAGRFDRHMHTRAVWADPLANGKRRRSRCARRKRAGAADISAAGRSNIKENIKRYSLTLGTNLAALSPWADSLASNTVHTWRATLWTWKLLSVSWL